MPQTSDSRSTVIGESRRCFREPIPEIFDAARLLDAAATAYLRNRSDLAAGLLEFANMPAIRDWLDSIWGARSKYVQYRQTPESKAAIPKAERIPLRMPSAETKKRLHLRDGFHCRCCGIPVIRMEVRRYFCTKFPGLRLWGKDNASQHAAFQAMWVQYDHVVPHAHGGTNDYDNLLITCAACNYGRMQFTFDEVGIANPMDRDPIQSQWDGLERVLPSSPFTGKAMEDLGAVDCNGMPTSRFHDCHP